MASANPPPAFPTPRGFAPATAAQAMPAPAAPQQVASPTKDVNTAALCRVGQEFVQEIVQKTAEIFGILKTIQLPNEVNQGVQGYQERKAKLDENVRTLTTNFKKLRLIYDKVNENTGPLQQRPLNEMLPVQTNDGEVGGDRPRQSDTLKYVSEEHTEVVQQVELRNEQLKEVIDQLRTIIWEINTMMAMRRA